MAQKIRADALACEQGLAESREKAKSLIMAARILLPDGSPVPKPGHLYAPETALSLAPGKEYVSRGAYKLLTLLDGFKINVSDLICLDAGASTGGFTDCLLRAGARKVYAVDVGNNQLHEKLKADSRVVNLEGVNLRSAPLDLIPEPVDFLCGDVSFISLTHILPTCDSWLKPGGLAALLIKPQFELSPREVPKGVVKSPESRQKAVDKILAFCANELGWEIRGVLPAQIRGPKGNQEYMALFQKKDAGAIIEPGVSMPEKTISPDKISQAGESEPGDGDPAGETGPLYLDVPVEEARKLGTRILARHAAAFEALRDI